MQVNGLLVTQSPTAKNYLAEKVSSDQVEKPWSRVPYIDNGIS